MEINLMINLKDNIKVPNTVAPSNGLSVQKIEDLEKKYNNEKLFPKAFREFLFLGGEYFNCGFDYLGDGIDGLQEICKEEMEMAGQMVDRPYFAFDVLDSQYSVVLLDEEEEDPKVYLLCPFLAQGGEESLLRPNEWKFSDLVNEHIRRVKNDIPF